MENNKLEKFINSDLIVKKVIIELSPEKYDSPIRYKIALLRGIKDIKNIYISVMNNIIKDNMSSNKVEDIINHIIQELYYLDSKDLDSLSFFYSKYITKMTEDFLNEVDKNYIGYKLIKPSIGRMINNDTSINELLHIMHSSVMNDENIYQDIPIIDTKYNFDEYGKDSITLRGYDNDIARDIFNKIPTDKNELFIGITDIVSLKDKILIMVRDRGHALTIEINLLDNEMSNVNYFIPKICNMEMVNNIRENITLKGANNSSLNISDKSKTASGSFTINKKLLGSVIAEKDGLISMVPTDDDMVINNNMHYSM